MTTQTATTHAPNAPKPRRPAIRPVEWEPGTVLVGTGDVARGTIQTKFIVVQDRLAILDKEGHASTTGCLDTREVERHISGRRGFGRGTLKRHDDFAIVVAVFERDAGGENEACSYDYQSCQPIRRRDFEVYTPDAEQRAVAAREQALREEAGRQMRRAQRCLREGVIRWVLRQAGIRAPTWMQKYGHEWDLMCQMAALLVEKGIVPAPVVPTLREWQVVSSLAGLVVDLDLGGKGPALSNAKYDDGALLDAGEHTSWPSCNSRYCDGDEERLAALVAQTKVVYPSEGLMFDLDDEERLAECAARL